MSLKTYGTKMKVVVFTMLCLKQTMKAEMSGFKLRERNRQNRHMMEHQ